MIKNAILGMLLIISTWGYSQQNKNQFIINTNIQFHSSNNSINLGGINAGYFVSNHFAIGISGNYYQEKSSSNYTDLFSSHFTESISTSSYSGLFARYSYVGTNHKLGFFMNFGSGYRWTKSNSTQTTITNDIKQITKTTIRTHGYSVGVSPGIIYFLNSKFSIETMLADISFRADYTKSDYSQSIEKSNVFETAFITSNINIGFSYYFGCKKREEKVKE